MDKLRKKKVILDVDTGSDDAVAILSAALADELEVLGITVAHGNQPLEYTLPNTLQVVELLGQDIPVFGGFGVPLVQDLSPGRRVNAGEVRAETVIEGKPVEVHPKRFSLPSPTIRAQEEHACSWLLRTLKQTKEKITLIPVGPMTNLAAVLRMDPSAAGGIEEIVLMGGGVNVHNRAFRSETNFYNDPEAAKILLNSGIKTTIVGLDATHSAWFGYDHAARLREIGNPAADFAAGLLHHRIEAANLIGARKEPNSALHDVLAVCAVIDPAVLTDVRREKCDVDISGGIADGALMVNRRSNAVPDLPTYVAYRADGDKLFDMLCGQLRNFRGK